MVQLNKLRIYRLWVWIHAQAVTCFWVSRWWGLCLVLVMRWTESASSWILTSQQPFRVTSGWITLKIILHQFRRQVTESQVCLLHCCNIKNQPSWWGEKLKSHVCIVKVCLSKNMHREDVTKSDRNSTSIWNWWVCWVVQLNDSCFSSGEMHWLFLGYFPDS